MGYVHKPLSVSSVLKSHALQSSFYLPHQPRLRTFVACSKTTQRLLSGIAMNGHGDLNNAHAARVAVEFAVDSGYRHRSFAIEAGEDDADVREMYRPFLLPERFAASDWVEQLELSSVLKLVESEIFARKQDRVRILVLYGSLRSR
jgi:hypothetical protein